MVLEKLAEIGQVDAFYEAIDSDDFERARRLMRRAGIDVETIGFGEVDAAAALVFLGGKSRIAIEDCQFFFHEGRYTIQDQVAPVHTHEEAISVFRRELHHMIHIIARETNNDTEVVAAMLRKSKIMHADEAREFGLVHQIVGKLPLKQQEEKGFGFGPKN